MRVDLVSTGDEILLGESLDTNAAYASATLTDHGFEVGRRLTCSDRREDIAAALDGSLQEADCVICCGGLGPTLDDRTAEALAEALGVPLQLDQTLLEGIRQRFATLGIPWSENQQRQARLPAGAQALPNPNGSAPGIFARRGERLAFCLPGPPREYRAMLEDRVLGLLEAERARRGESAGLLTRVLRTFGKGEGWIESTLGDLEGEVPGLTLGFQATFPEVLVKLRARGGDPDARRRIVDEAERRVRDRLGDLVLPSAGRSLPETVLDMLAERGLTLAVAESCTGGLVGALLTDVPGASRVFVLSAVTYANEMKTRLLGVPAEILATHGAVSEECARAMAEGARRLSGASLAIAVTGIAGPEGGTPEKPVGTVFLGIADAAGTEARRRNYGVRDREWIRRLSAHAALDLIRRRLSRVP